MLISITAGMTTKIYGIYKPSTRCIEKPQWDVFTLIIVSEV